MADVTLLDIIKANNADAVAGLIDESAKAHPEFMSLFSRTIKGLNYKTLVRTGLPTVAFRNVNEGVATSKGTYVNKLVETFILAMPWQADKAAADAYEDGAEAYCALEASGIIEAGFQHAASQIYYGVSADDKGFAGFVAQVDSSMVLDAGGTTASTGSSVWAVRSNPKDAALVIGQNGELAVSDVYSQRVLDDSSNPYVAYCQDLNAYLGLQIGNKYSIGQIKDLTEDSGKGLTDDLLAKLIELFPVGKLPDFFFMNRRSLRQLRNSRTATNPTGMPAPFPTEALGIPIMVTDAITSTETLS